MAAPMLICTTYKVLSDNQIGVRRETSGLFPDPPLDFITTVEKLDHKSEDGVIAIILEAKTRAGVQRAIEEKKIPPHIAPLIWFKN